MANKLTRAIGEMNADLEEMVEKFQDRYVESFEKLLEDVDSRDPEVWANSGADLDVKLSDFSGVPVSARDDDWTIAVTALLAAAQMQAMYDAGILDELVRLAERNGDTVNGIASRMTPEQISESVDELPGSKITEAVRAERGQITR